MTNWLNRFSIWIAGFVGSMFSGVAGWAAKFFTKKAANIIGALTVLAVATLAFFAALNGLLVGISLVVPAFMVQAAGHAIPDNALACVSAVASGKMLRHVYDWKISLTKDRNYIT